MFYLFML
jgi:hypothetical protein